MIEVNINTDIDSQEDVEYVRSMLGDIEWRLDNLYTIKDKAGHKIKFRQPDLESFVNC